MKRTDIYQHIGGPIRCGDLLYWTDPNEGEESEYATAQAIVGDEIEVGTEQSARYKITDCERVKEREGGKKLQTSFELVEPCPVASVDGSLCLLMDESEGRYRLIFLYWRAEEHFTYSFSFVNADGTLGEQQKITYNLNGVFALPDEYKYKINITISKQK